MDPDVTPGARRIAGPAWLSTAWQGIYLNSAGTLVNCGHRHRSRDTAKRCARREARYV